MGKLTISRLALATMISGFLIFPPAPSFAAPKWLQEMFTVDPPRSQKSKQRRAKTRSAQSGNAIRLPATAPLPETAPRDTVVAAARVPLDEKALEVLARKSEEASAPSAQQPYEEPFDNSPTEPPIPEFRPDSPSPQVADKAPAEPGESEPAPPEPAQPVPAPTEPAQSEAARSDETDLPSKPPIPQFRPDKPAPKPAPGEDDADIQKAEPEEPAPPPDPRSAARADPSGKLPAEEVACRRRLAELGVKFEERKEETDPSGCSIPYPIVIENLGTGIGLEPHAEMNCAMAEAAARFAKGAMSSAATEVFGSTLKSISHASAYVCRPRNGTRKLSEHAFGNALDIASFELSDGTTIAVEPAPPEKNARYLAKVREAACGPFKTVLGPGSDADHAEHFHFDLAPRRNGGTFCQ